ncbi:cytochrome P450-like protein, partial [Leptotrombidium deliense]
MGQLAKEYEINGHAGFISVNQVYLVVFKPSLMAEIFGKVHNKTEAFIVGKELLGSSLIFSDFNEWKVKRKQLKCLMPSKCLKEYIKIANVLVNELIGNVNLQSDENTATVIGIPHDAISKRDEYLKKIAVLKNKFPIMIALNLLVSLFSNYRIGTGKCLKTTLEEVQHFTKNAIAFRQKQLSQSLYDTILDNLSKIKEKDSSLSDDDILGEVDSLIPATLSGITVTLQWLILVVGNHPQVQQKLRTELMQVVGDRHREISIKDLSNLKYTDWVIKETLRLFPAVHTIIRRAETDFNFEGHRYAKNTVAALLVFESHRDKQTFENANEFIPERFEDTKLNSA